MSPENRELKAEIIRKFGSQFAFSLFLGWHEARVSKVVRGRLTLDDATKQEWAQLLEAPVDRLFPPGNSHAR